MAVLETISADVEAVPVLVIAVEDAYGKLFTAVEEAVIFPPKYEAPLMYALPFMPSVRAGVVVPMPTLPPDVANHAPCVVEMDVEEAKVAERRFPLVKVRSESSVKRPAVVRNGRRVVVRFETVSAVVEAVPETVMAVVEA